MTAFLLLASSVFSATATAQEPTQDLVFFTSFEARKLYDADNSAFNENDTTPTVDVIYSRTNGRFRVFGEYLLTDDEHELERLQVGWQLSEGSRFWLGRFHHSGSYWNTEHHHGQFLQTSISRPSIEEFEDTGGVLPLHVTGVLLEQREEFEWGSALQVSLSAGLSGRLTDTEFETFDLLHPESGFEPAINARVSFFPDALGESQVGLSIGQHSLALDSQASPMVSWDPTANEIELETFGFYVDWSWPRWRLFASALNVSAVTIGGTNGNSRAFTASYVQGEFQLRPIWRLYGRVEQTTGDESYLTLFPGYVRRQAVLGAKLSIGEKHAVSIEGTNSEAYNERFHRVSIQWSAVFP